MHRGKLLSRIWTGMIDSPTGRALSAEEEWLTLRTHESGSCNPLFQCESETVSTTIEAHWQIALHLTILSAFWWMGGGILLEICLRHATIKEIQRLTQSKIEPNNRAALLCLTIISIYTIKRLILLTVFNAICIKSARKTENTATCWLFIEKIKV